MVLRFKRSYWVGKGERQRDSKGERERECVERERLNREWREKIKED